MRLIQIFPLDADGVPEKQPTMIDADKVIAIRPREAGATIVLPDDWSFKVKQGVGVIAQLVDPS